VPKRKDWNGRWIALALAIGLLIVASGWYYVNYWSIMANKTDKLFNEALKKIEKTNNMTDLSKIMEIYNNQITNIFHSLLSPAVILIAGIIIISVFLWLVSIGYSADKTLSRGEMRRAIAGIFVIGFHVIILIFLLLFPENSKDLIVAYIEFVGLVVGFYFGSRTAQQQQTQSEQKLIVENVSPKNDEIVITVRNLTNSEQIVDRIYVKDKPYNLEGEMRIPPGKYRDIPLKKDMLQQAGINENDVVAENIKIATKSGVFAP